MIEIRRSTSGDVTVAETVVIVVAAAVVVVSFSLFMLQLMRLAIRSFHSFAKHCVRVAL